MLESQASRAICITNVRRFTMVGAKDGSITIRPKSVNGEVIEKKILNSRLKLSNLVLIGSYMLLVLITIKFIFMKHKFFMVGICKGHSAAITCFDFSSDRTYLRSVFNAYEVLFF
jgi:hypothetical protein